MKEILVVVTVVVYSVQTSYTAPTEHGKLILGTSYTSIKSELLVADYRQMMSVHAESTPKDNQYQVDNSQTFKLLQAALSSDQVKLPLTQGQANEQMQVLEAIGKQMIANGSQEELQRALQQIFDMPSFPIIRLYPSDG